MKNKLNRISLGEIAGVFWNYLVGILRLKRVGTTRNLNSRTLYWIRNHHLNAVQTSSLTLDVNVESDVDSADYWLLKGEALIQQDRFMEANHCFDQALGHDSADAFALNYKGYCLYKLGYYETALSCLRQAALLDPRHPEINIIKALCLCHLHQFEEALTYFTRALRYGCHESPDLWNNKGFCLARLGRRREASIAFRIALDKCSAASLEILGNVASVMVEMGAYHQALEYFNRALELDAEDHVLLNNLGYCLEVLGHSDQALQCYEKAVLQAPDNPTYLCNQGFCMLRLQYWDRAFECLQEVVRHDPRNGIAWCGIAAAALAKGFTDEALSYYNKALTASN